jgi:pyrimidine-nucleoside phosphorylase
MDPYEVIKAKRDGETLDRETIHDFVQGFTNDDIPDYQMSAWLMAVWFNGMTSRERADLTSEMVQTGLTLDYPAISEVLVDKHSTGGVGDGVSLSLVPLVASLGVKIPMMSGRGLGHTGGTLDKLESIPGFEVHYSQAEINQALEDVGAIIMGQTDDVAPADGEMYALRDVTATIDSVDLIASSIMSKKIAEGMDALVLDVKTGSGAFMEDYEDSVELARAMVEIGRELDKDMEALITDMEQPLGRAVGNALEMRQHIEILNGNGPKDLRELVARLAGSMLALGGQVSDREAGYDLAKERLNSGDALEKLRQIIEWQNGDPSVIDDPGVFPQASESTMVEADESGIVESIDAFEVGMATRSLGAGRETMDDEIDYAAGVLVERKVGEPVETGDPLFELRYNDDSELDQAKSRLESAVEITDRPVEPDPLVQAIIDHEGKELKREILRPDTSTG